MKIESSFLISGEETTLLPFDKVQNNSFNFVEFQDKDIITDDIAALFKQKSNSCVISILKKNPGAIKHLKLTNQNILTWDDLWIDEQSGNSVDPEIESINLQRNSLLYVNFNLSRKRLKNINLEGNIYLKTFTGSNLPALETINFENCINLEVVNLGQSKNIRLLSLKNCRLTEEGLERTLSSFTPTKTASANIYPGTLPLFRKKYETLLDLRGNDINWGNRRIASKIRLLVTNNWLVLWDNPPPTSIIPIQMYAFFPKNIGDKQIEEYYTGMQMQQIPPTTTTTQASDPSSQSQADDQVAQAGQASAAAAQSQPSPSPAPQPSPSPTPTPTPTPSPAPSPSPTPSPSPGGGYY